MKFSEAEIDTLDLTKPESLRQLIAEKLCARHSAGQSDATPGAPLAKLLRRAKRRGFRLEQFNELLLLLNQDRVSGAFFDFFFGKQPVGLDGLRKGVTRFRGFAMLCFGNFRSAYHALSSIEDRRVLFKKLCPAAEKPSDLRARYRRRPGKFLDIERIDGKKTWYVGELTGQRIDTHLRDVDKALGRESNAAERRRLRRFLSRLTDMATEYEEVQQQALSNTDVYLTWDFVDVYVATSMRYQWEFEETHRFIRAVFSGEQIEHLNLRYFDPTQSKCTNARDKGLVEGLMLKRAKCTIYMAQETDTMGKDSELAATLAQGRPVIVYVPKVNATAYARTIQKYPLDYFYRRVLLLKAEGIFEKPECAAMLKRISRDYQKLTCQFVSDYERHRSQQPFELWADRDEREFKNPVPYFGQLCRVLATAEQLAYDRRAKVLKGLHPLAMQVDMQTGVAVGVLVVRSARECAGVLRNLLLNRVEFSIEDEQTIEGVDPGLTLLKEDSTGSQFRVVTRNEKLTNSFWNLFDGRERTVQESLP